MEEGRRAFDAGDYRWAAQILHHLVFAQPDNQAARDLQADAYEQMGYQIEGPQWRGIFLTAARELREGVQPATFATASPDTILVMAIDTLFDSLPPTSSATRRPRPTCGSTSPSPAWARPGRRGSCARCSTPAAAPPPTRS